MTGLAGTGEALLHIHPWNDALVRILPLSIVLIAGLSSCVPAMHSKQQLRPYTVTVKATPQQIFAVLKMAPGLIPDKVCTDFRIVWGISYGNPSFRQVSANEAVLVIESINVAKALNTTAGHEIRFSIIESGEGNQVNAEMTWYKNNGNLRNPEMFNKCAPEILALLKSEYAVTK